MSAHRIVLVEDNPGDILLIEMALQENGVVCDLLKFHDGQEALRALCPADGDKPDTVIPDLILLDLNTPKMDGFQLLTRLRQVPSLKQTPIAILTSSQAPGDKARAQSLGANRYIQKPSHLDEFLAKVGKGVKELLDGGEPAALSTSAVTG